MPLKIDAGAARKVLEAALVMAQEPSELPQEWLDRSRAVGAAVSKTYVAALGTALLARATDDAADPMSIKATPGRDDAYSARTLCHGTLVPFARARGFDLGATGREPLNNQPFFRYERIDEMDRVRDRLGLDVLLAALHRVGTLPARDAQPALAAYLRTRIDAANDGPRIDTRGLGLGIEQTVAAIRQFTLEDPQGGKRAQAVCAGVLDLLYEDVRMGRVNDPSRRLPGDVQALRGRDVLLAVEVRQKRVDLDDVHAYAQKLQDSVVANGLMVAVSLDQEALDRARVRASCEDGYGIMMNIIETVEELVTQGLTWAGVRLDVALEELRSSITSRLEEIEVGPAGLRRWDQILRQGSL